ncbi:Uncharacterised protein [Vibrio cholerae]|nr:Uncharacterised protein [Vibrio cholerae]
MVLLNQYRDRRMHYLLSYLTLKNKRESLIPHIE